MKKLFTTILMMFFTLICFSQSSPVANPTSFPNGISLPTLTADNTAVKLVAQKTASNKLVYVDIAPYVNNWTLTGSDIKNNNNGYVDVNLYAGKKFRVFANGSGIERASITDTGGIVAFESVSTPIYNLINGGELRRSGSHKIVAKDADGGTWEVFKPMIYNADYTYTDQTVVPKKYVDDAIIGGISGYVPYTGATSSLDLGLNMLTVGGVVQAQSGIEVSGGDANIDGNVTITGALTASNFSGNSSGTNSGNQTTTGVTNETTVANGSTNPVVGIASAYTTARNAYADAKVENNLTASTTVAPSKTAVNIALALKADDATVLHQAGTETASGMKTFTPGITFGQVTSPTYARGKLVYDTDNESLTFYNNDSNVALQIGQEQFVRVVNNTGSTISNGSAVYVSGSSSGLPTIALANGNSASTTVGLGLVTENIANGAVGYVTSIGAVRGLNTSGFTTGSVFISATTPGALTQTAPLAPNYRYRVGFVTVVDASAGVIHVTPSTASLGNGAANQIFGMNAAGTAQETKSIVGTTNQISVTHSTNTVTVGLSLLSTTVNLNFPSTVTNNNSDLTLTLTGAALGDVVCMGVPNSSMLTRCVYFAWVSAANTITCRFMNHSSSSADPAAGDFTFKILK